LDSEAPVQLGLSLRAEAGVPDDAVIALYIGNLESYQGIDLLISSFKVAFERAKNGYVLIIGGRESHIAAYKRRVVELQMDSHFKFLGAKPVSNLSSYLSQADLLLSPRVRGNNTPMKIYSYLHSGRAVLATDLPTHTQVLHSGVAFLAKPDPDSFGAALLEAFSSEEKRLALGKAAKDLAEQRYTYRTFSAKLTEIYSNVKARIANA
jgi:glycosyltransferase involved in cell wall biosynthesis